MDFLLPICQSKFSPCHAAEQSATAHLAAILIDGKLVFAPTIHQQFSRSVEISGDLTQEEAERIVKGIKAK